VFFARITNVAGFRSYLSHQIFEGNPDSGKCGEEGAFAYWRQQTVRLFVPSLSMGGGGPIPTFVKFWDFAVLDEVRQEIGLIASLDAGQDSNDVAPAVVQTVADATSS